MANIKDVAREAGVSVATVSRVFNGGTQVAEATAQRVREVATRLDYVPDAAARSLITGRTHALGVVLPELHGEFFTEVIRGLDRAARGQGMHLLVSGSNTDAASFEAALRSMRGRVDGLVLMTPDRVTSVAAERFRDQVPVVLLNPATDAGRCDSITFDNAGGAHLMTQHLLSLGHLRVATVTGPIDNVDANQRLAGYRHAMRDAGMADPALELQGDFTEVGGRHAVGELLALTPRPTAVFVANDHMAVSLMAGLQERGVSVPGEIAVGGFDDIAMARYVTPALSTVHVDLDTLGQHAVARLLERARGEAPPEGRVERLCAALVIRKSCGS
ncbi:MAG: LacI family DNA-binding transcriptional regulator [Candidatus Eisenbacteria bacterium]